MWIIWPEKGLATCPKASVSTFVMIPLRYVQKKKGEWKEKKRKGEGFGKKRGALLLRRGWWAWPMTPSHPLTCHQLKRVKIPFAKRKEKKKKTEVNKENRRRREEKRFAKSIPGLHRISFILLPTKKWLGKWVVNIEKVRNSPLLINKEW